MNKWFSYHVGTVKRMSLIEHMIKAGWTRSFSCGQENDLISRQAAIDDENTKGAAK